MRSHRLAAAGALALAMPSPADVKLYGRKDEELSPSEIVREFRGVKTSLEKQHREVQDWIAKAGQSIKDTGEIAADGPPADVLTENRLFSAYGDKIEILRRPEAQNPIVLAKK